jgi:Cys-tRNA(Pro)/Cys-tRNA(Cys) deacylase
VVIPNELVGRARCEAALAAAGLPAEILAPGVPMPTVELAAAAIGVAPEQIIKTLVFSDPDGACVVAIGCGTGRIDRKEVAHVTGTRSLSMASPGTVLAVTGYPAGGVAPLGHRTPLPVVIDQAVTSLETVYGGGGEHDLLLRLSVRDLLRVSGGIVARIGKAG